MNFFKNFFLVLMIVFIHQICFSQTIEEYIQKAESFNQSGDLEQAAKVMEEAIQKYPDNSTAHSYLGSYQGTRAGQTQNYMEAGQLVGVAYEMLDKAVSLDPNNPIARFHRGLMGVKVPPFFNKLDQGIEDLKFFIKMFNEAPDKVPTEMAASAYNFLGEGYQKKENMSKAIAAYEEVVKLAPETDLAKAAQKNITKLSKPEKKEKVEQKKYTVEDVEKFEQQVKENPNDLVLLVQLGQAYNDTRNYEKAEKVAREAIQKDSTNADAYKVLLETLGEMADKGYDERIYEDTDLRSKLAFEIVEIVDKALEIAPYDLELRLARGSIGVMMPFFVGKLDEAIKDLELIQNSDAPDDIKAEAIFWLGYAYQKKATTKWIEVITEYSESNASQMALESMRPNINRVDFTKQQKPFLVVNFVLGFRDELPPQSAIWIEDVNGKYIKTIYVSGFSGFAKDQQVNLPEWAESSEFKNVDAVTAASINVGEHNYAWDLKDSEGKKIMGGEYVIKIEAAYWPSMEYQFSSAKIKVGKEDSQVIVKEGNIIPYIEVKYFSD